MYCAKCGSTIPDGSKFCPKCGAAVGSQNAGASQVHANPQPQIIVVEDSDNEKTEATPMQQTVGVIALVVGIVSLICLLFSMTFAFIMAIVGEFLGIFVGKSTVGKVGAGICSFVIGLCVIFWIVIAAGIASCYGALQ